MYRTATAIVLFVALCLAFNVCHGQGIIKGPENDAFYAGAQVKLFCQATPGDRVMFVEFATNPNGAVISDGDQLAPGHPNKARYIINANTTAGTYELTIINTTLADGGMYQCVDENTASKRGCQLVVLLQAPNCTTTLPPGGIVVVGVHYTIECSVYYGSSIGIYPLMHWTGPGDFNQLQVNNINNSLSGVGFDVQKAMDAKSFRQTTNFTQIGFGGTDMATNIPSYYHIYNSMTMFVRYPPENIYYTPVKSSYEIGDVLTCFCDAMPLPQYKWTDMNTNIDYFSQTMSITDSMVGPRIFRCLIVNAVGEGNIFVNTTVNPKTTPTLPTTTVPTTTPPAVSNCLDVTGRWEYQRAANSKAVLCMYVDGEQNGKINGLFWNDTLTDAHYMDIVGRTRNNIYDETGLVGIWPLNVGVTGFALECHRCSGVESLLLNAVSRTSTDAAFCGDGGTIITGIQYPFKRVNWAYPCGPASTVKELRAISYEAAVRRQKRHAEASIFTLSSI